MRVEYALPGARSEGREAIASHAEAYLCAVPDCRLEIREERVYWDAATLLAGAGVLAG